MPLGGGGRQRSGITEMDRSIQGAWASRLYVRRRPFLPAMSALRLDRVATMPGALRSARTYSLVLDGSTLYVLDIGPAMGPKPRTSGLVKWLSDKMIARIKTRTDATVAAGLADLDARRPEALAEEKGSFRFSPGEVTACEMGTNGWGRTSLKLETSARSFAFVASPGEEIALSAFGDQIRAWAA